MARRFTASEAAAWVGLLDTFSRLDRAIDAEFQRHNRIRHVEYEVLLRLHQAPAGKMRIQELAAQRLLSGSGLSRLVDRLVGMGLLAREAAAEDGRGSYAVLTAQGRELLEAAADRHIEFVREQFLRKLTVDEVRTLGTIWAKLAG